MIFAGGGSESGGGSGGSGKTLKIYDVTDKTSIGTGSTGPAIYLNFEDPPLMDATFILIHVKIKDSSVDGYVRTIYSKEYGYIVEDATYPATFLMDINFSFGEGTTWSNCRFEFTQANITVEKVLKCEVILP